jgi:hypothetical protein
MCHGNVTSGDACGLARGIGLVLAFACQHRPGVLAGRVHMRAYALAWLHGPGDDGRVFRFVNHRPNRLALIGPKMLGDLEDSVLRHAGALLEAAQREAANG